METSGIGGAQSYGVNQGTTSVKSVSAEKSEYQELVDYFFESPAQRILDNWLRAHKISKEQYNAMTPAEKDAIAREIADEIKKRTEEKAKERSPIAA